MLSYVVFNPVVFLIKDALEIQEDVALTSFADARGKTFRKSKALKHDEVW